MKDLHDALPPDAEPAPDGPSVGLAAAVPPATDESGGSPESIWNLEGKLLPFADHDHEGGQVSEAEHRAEDPERPARPEAPEAPEPPEHDRGPLVLVLTIVGVLLFALGMLAIFSRGADPTEIVAGAGEERDPTTTTSGNDGSTGVDTGGDSGPGSTADGNGDEDTTGGGADGSAEADDPAPPPGTPSPPAEPGGETSSTQVTRPPGDAPPAPAPAPSPGAPPVTGADIPGGFAELVTAIADLDVVLGQRFLGAPLYDSIQVFDQFVQADGSTAPIGADVIAAVAALQTPVAVGFVSSEPAPGTPAIWVRVSQPVAGGNTFQFGVELRCPLCGSGQIITVVPVVREADGCWHLAPDWHAALYGTAPMC